MSELSVELDSEGYVIDPEQWNEALAERFAEEEGITLNEQYWAILGFIRNYWSNHHIAPDVRHVIKFLCDTMAFDKKRAKKYLFELFPYGYVKQACKISGMQRPRVWSTG